MNKQNIGKEGENLANNYLITCGYKVLETNFRTRFGEIDIVALDNDTLVFVEVKTRHSRAFGLPEEAVGKKKISHLVKAAQYYRLMRENLPEAERFDVVAIEPNSNRIELIKNITQ